MLQYLIILLDDSATSFCYYDNNNREPRLISLENLRNGIRFAMKQNLMIQFVYPNYELPEEYLNAIKLIDHNNIMSSTSNSSLKADIVVFNDWVDFEKNNFSREFSQVYVLRTHKDLLFKKYEKIIEKLPYIFRLNIFLTDETEFTEEDFKIYESVLEKISMAIKDIYLKGESIQINLLTDRLFIDKMNNCNAGYDNITLAPNGKFYICPAFYIEDEMNFYGDLKNELDIKNLHLYNIKYAPLCRICDAFQCKRCVWLNRKMTLEVNTPSHEQCVVAHIERNASRRLLNEIRKISPFLPDKNIEEIDYLDPFDIKVEY